MKLRHLRKRQQKPAGQKLANRRGYVRNPSLDYADTVYILTQPLTQPFYSLKHLEN